MQTKPILTSNINRIDNTNLTYMKTLIMTKDINILHYSKKKIGEKAYES